MMAEVGAINIFQQIPIMWQKIKIMKNAVQVHIIGEIASASGFPHSSLFCKYNHHCISLQYLHLHMHLRLQFHRHLHLH